jgi:hypothetical protein
METVTHHTASHAPSGEVKSLWVYTDTGNTLEYVGELQLEGDTLTIWFGQRGSAAYYRGAFSEEGNVLTGAYHYR